MSNSGAWKLDSLAAAKEPEPPTRLVNMNRLGTALLDLESPPVKCLFVYNSNALATTPRQQKVREGLEREDLFTVVFDSVMTDTARYADVVLPATAFLEHHELSRGYGAYSLFESAPVAAPAGESRPNPEVFAELCRRTGVARPDEPERSADLAAAILGAHPNGRRVSRRDRAGRLFGPRVRPFARSSSSTCFRTLPTGKRAFSRRSWTARPRPASTRTGKIPAPAITRSRSSPPPPTGRSARLSGSWTTLRRRSRSTPTTLAPAR